jgi:hypothetical protein
MGVVTRGEDDFLARPEPLAVPREEHGSSGYAEGLRRTTAKRRASRDSERGDAMRKALVVGASVMGAAVVVAAVFAVLVFAGLFTVSPGVGGGHGTETLVQQPASTPDTPAPSTTTVPLAPVDTTGATPPTTAAQTGRSPLPSSTRVTIPPSTAGTAGTQAPALPSLNSIGSQQLSSASPPSLGGAPVPAPAPTTAPAESPTCHGNSKKCRAAGRSGDEVSSTPGGRR